MPELYPYNRQEIFLKGILDDDPESLPIPETREEIYLKSIAEKKALPAIESGDAGKILTVNQDEDGAEWTTPSVVHKYAHFIYFRYSTISYITCIIIDSNNTNYLTIGDFKAAFKAAFGTNHWIMASGWDATDQRGIWGLYVSTEDELKVLHSASSSFTITESGVTSVFDTKIEI